MRYTVPLLFAATLSIRCAGPESHPPTWSIVSAVPDGGRTSASRDASRAEDAARTTDASDGGGDAALLVEASFDGPAEARTCPQDVPPTCPSPAPTYADVSPTLLKYCAFCHQQGRYAPDITKYDTAYAGRDGIFTTLTTCTMPEPWPTDEERQVLLAWLVCGAPE